MSQKTLIFLVKKFMQSTADIKFLSGSLSWGKAGIRAQLLNLKNNQLIDDFVFEGDKNSFHILNAVSPAFTCALPFSKYLVEQMQKHYLN